MPLNLESRRKATIPLAIPVDSDVLNVRYRASHMTPASLAELNRARDEAVEAIEAVSKEEKAEASKAVETSPLTTALMELSESLAENPEIKSEITELLDSGIDKTKAMFERIEEMQNLLMDELLDVVDSWDLMDGDDVVPLTREGLVKHDVDFDLMAQILSKIREAKTPGKK